MACRSIISQLFLQSAGYVFRNLSILKILDENLDDNIIVVYSGTVSLLADRKEL